MFSSRTKVWRYSFPSVKGEGWAIFFLDEAGCFAALSDYGNWSYRWNIGGLPEGMSFAQFLLEIDDDYLLRKLAPTPKYDAKGTLRVVRETILGIRRERQLTKQEARSEWDALIEIYDGLSSDYRFGEWLQNTILPDAAECYVTKYCDSARMFIQRCIPRLKEAIKKDISQVSGISSNPLS